MSPVATIFGHGTPADCSLGARVPSQALPHGSAAKGRYRPWKHIGLALAHSDKLEDRKLARQIIEFVKDMPMLRHARTPARELQRTEPQAVRTRPGPELER